jgi:hypothetical protein
MDYARKYSEYPELVNRLTKLKYLIMSLGSIDGEIDFELSLNDNMVREMSIYISGSFPFDGILDEFIGFFKDIQVKMDKVFNNIKLDGNLNLSRTMENTFLGGLVSYINFGRNDDILNYEIEFILEI